MKHQVQVTLALVLGASACTTVSLETPRPPAFEEFQLREKGGNTLIQEEALVEDGPTVESGDFVEADGPIVTPPLPPKYPVDPELLKVFQSEKFKRWFATSFTMETEVEPPVTLLERDAILKAAELMEEDRLEKAIKTLERERGRSESAQIEFNLAHFYFQQDRFEEALELYEAATQKYPNFRRAWHFIGICNMRLDRTEEAMPAFTKVIELGGGNGLMYGLLGYGYTTLEKFVPAESAYRMACLLDPDSFEYQMGLANALYKQNRFADATALFSGMIQDDPDRKELWSARGRCYLGMKDRLKAAEDFEVLHMLGGETVDTLYTLGDIYTIDGLYSESIKSYSAAFELDPEKNLARTVRAARDLTNRGAYPEAESLIAAIEGVPALAVPDEDRIEILNLRARMAVARGDGEEEARSLEEIVALNPRDGRSLILLGRFYSRNDRNEEAVFAFERAADVEEFEAEAKMRHGQHLVKEGQYARALELLKSSMDLQPKPALRDYIDEVQVLSKASQ